MSLKIDVFLFAGQSNMAGRGNWRLAPKIKKGEAFEYRAISNPDHLVHLEEPFGVNENNPLGIYEPGMKTGGLVASFCQEYYKLTGRVIVGISASKGGSCINEWQPKSAYFKDSVIRISNALNWLRDSDYQVNHCYLLWMQGETDGDLKTNGRQYQKLLDETLSSYLRNSIEECFIIAIGNHRDNKGLYKTIRDSQIELCQRKEKIKLVSTYLSTDKARQFMKDEFHYKQQAYNDCGIEAAKNTVKFLKD